MPQPLLYCHGQELTGCLAMPAQGRKHLRRAERAAHAGEDAVHVAEVAATGEAKTEDAPIPGRLLPAIATGDAINCSRGVH